MSGFNYRVERRNDSLTFRSPFYSHLPRETASQRNLAHLGRLPFVSTPSCRQNFARVMSDSEEEEVVSSVFSRSIASSSMSPRADFDSASNSYMSVAVSSGVPIFSAEDGALLCNITSCSSLEAADLSFYMHQVNEFFKENFQLVGIDGKGADPITYAELRELNAYSHCEEGSCELRFHNHYAQSEVIGHEYMHAIMDSHSSLGTSPEADALHESVADVFGLTFKWWLDYKELLPSTLTSRWVILENDPIHKRDFRSFMDMCDFKRGGDPHKNSLIPSHAFYLAVQAQEELVREKISPYEIQRVVADVWMKVVKCGEEINSFEEFAIKSLEMIELYYGNDELLKKAVEDAWICVGILEEDCQSDSDDLSSEGSVTDMLQSLSLTSFNRRL